MKNHILNLLILFLALALIMLFEKNNDKFVGALRASVGGFGNLGNGNGPVQRPNSNMQNHPMSFSRQLYPAKIPYYPEVGRPCEGQCGPMGICKDGICTMRDQKGTVFNIPV